MQLLAVLIHDIIYNFLRKIVCTLTILTLQFYNTELKSLMRTEESSIWRKLSRLQTATKLVVIAILTLHNLRLK